MNGGPREVGERARPRWVWVPVFVAGAMVAGLASCGSQSEPWGAGAEEYLARLHETNGASYSAVMQFYTDDVEVDMRAPFDYRGVGRSGIAGVMRERDPWNRMAITADELPYLSLDGAVDPVWEHLDDVFGTAPLHEAPIYTVTDAGISSIVFTGSAQAGVGYEGASMEVMAPLVEQWVTAWATGDQDAVRALYADGAKLVDSVVGVRLDGADQISAAAAAATADGGLPGATLHEIPEGGGPAFYQSGRDSESLTHAVGLGDRRVLLLAVDESQGCPGDVAVVMWADENQLITREERFHRVDSVRRCFDTDSLAPGWWDSVTVPVTSTGSLQVRGQEIVLWNGSPEREELLRWALQQFADAGVPPPGVTSVFFAGEVADPWAEYGLDRVLDAALPLTAPGCPAEGCATWPAQARAGALQSLAAAWAGDVQRGSALRHFALAHDLEWFSALG